ncbi:hypothetical protein FSP39_024197 [Pinctada imbricata]|uniref:B box-type domain-containing protein n=1 Tax=Pinctada imbricata TaxID=66713 RepID=A0AA88YNE6_PINIB|nr:hypothetical protein FSP39_024197 [Pinctada imbricata]
MAEQKVSDVDSCSPKLCDICSRHGVHMKAVAECNECDMKYCGACIPEHRFLFMAGHKMEYIDGREGKPFPDLEKIPPFDFKDRQSIDTIVSLFQKNISFEEDTHTAYYVTDICISTFDDIRECYVTGCVAMDNKELLIADKNNMKLKLFDSNGSIITAADTPHVPWGITKVNQKSVATCGSGSAVLIWEVKGGDISVLKSIQVHEMAFGISNNTGLICTMHPHLDSLTFIGKPINAVINYRRFYDPNGKQLNFGFDIEMDELCAYVGCGLGDKRIIGISIPSLTIIWECPLLGNTCGVIELRGQLVVADMTNKKIESVSKSGKWLQTLVSLEFMEGRPQYMACNISGRTLFVSQFGSDIVTVFGVRVS